MPSKSQSGFAPIIIVVLLSIIAGSSVLVFKNIPLNQSEPTLTMEKQSTVSAQVKISPSPTVSKTPTLTTSKKTTPTLTKTPTSSAFNNSDSGSNNSNTTNPINTSSPTNTPTLVPTFTPTPTAAPFPSNPYVRVTYPNGGESFKVGDNVTIAWDTNMISNNITLAMCFMQTIDSNNTGSVIVQEVGVNIRSHTWTATIGNTTSNEKQLKIYMICRDFNGGTYFGKSENYFTVSK